MRLSSLFTSILLVILLLVPTFLSTTVEVYSQAGAPVPSADVDIQFGPEPSYGISARADINGELTLDLYQGVDHTYNIQAKGYLPKMGNISAVNNSGPVQLNVTLDPAALVEGYVKTPDGRPVIGAMVTSNIDSTFTDSNGYFAVYVEPGAQAQLEVYPPVSLFALANIFGDLDLAMFGLPEGFKDMVVFEPMRGNGYVIYKNVNVNLVGTRTQTNITLDFSARVAGSISYQNGTAVNNAVVMFMTQGVMVGYGGFSVSNQSGNYEVNFDLPNGPANISVTLGGEGWSLTMGNIIENYNVNCALPCVAPQNLDIIIPDVVKVSGRLIDKAGRPMPDIQIFGFMNNNSYILRMTTAPDGSFMGYLPVGVEVNLLALITFGLPPIMNVTLNVGNAPIDLGDVVANANLFYVSGTVQGYDPQNTYWRGTQVGVEATIQLGPFQQYTVFFDGELYNNGSFKIPVITNVTIPFLPFPPNIQYKLVLKTSYRAVLTYPGIALPDINQDVANVNVQVAPPPTFQLIIRVEAGGTPPSPMQRTFILTATYMDKTFNITVTNNLHISTVMSALLIFNPRGELYFYFDTLPGSSEFTIEIPTEMLGEPYTLTYYSFTTDNWEPLPAQVSTSGGTATFTFSNPENSDTLIVKIESTNVISEFNALFLLLTILMMLGLVFIIRRLQSL